VYAFIVVVEFGCFLDVSSVVNWIQDNEPTDTFDLDKSSLAGGKLEVETRFIIFGFNTNQVFVSQSKSVNTGST
jgi:hypothetical protein